MLALFVLEVDSRYYIKDFDQEWLASEVSSFWNEQSKSSIGLIPFHNVFSKPSS